LPYIGKLPAAEPGVYVATGFGGNGITYSHVASISLTDLIINGESRYENLFDPSRVKPVAGFKNFVMENADVVKQLVSKLMPADELESLSALAKGEAKVIEYENEKVALYKDNSGNLHAVNPACTHVKCQVAWNVVEQSWDCPCHGARYDADGKVLNAPAHLDLKHIELSNKQVDEAYSK
jgi:Rieske Fe-S protein